MQQLVNIFCVLALLSLVSTNGLKDENPGTLMGQLKRIVTKVGSVFKYNILMCILIFDCRHWIVDSIAKWIPNSTSKKA